MYDLLGNVKPEIKLLFDPIINNHFNTEVSSENVISKRNLLFLLIVGFVIMIIGWINYINLTTALSVKRIKEVGVRKISGGRRYQLTGQFLGESCLYNFLSFLVTVSLVQIIRSKIPEIFPDFDVDMVSDNYFFWGLFVLIFIAGTLLSSIYPSFVLSAYSPFSILGRSPGFTKRNFIRRLLLFFQLSSSIALIAGTIIVFSQIRYILNQNLGFDVRNTLVVQAPILKDSLFAAKKEYFKNSVIKHKDVTDITGGFSVPFVGSQGYESLVNRKSNKAADPFVFDGNGGVDANFVDFFQIKMLAGRNFMTDHPADRSAVLLSRHAAWRLGFTPDEAVGEKIEIGKINDLNFTKKEATILGIFEDYQRQTFHIKWNEGIMLTLNDYLLGLPYNVFALKINGTNYANLINTIRKEYESVFPGSVFNYSVLNEHYRSLYKDDIMFMNTISYFAGLAILISCLGLFGLVSIIASQHSKEIGIRKALGASANRIIVHFSKDFLKIFSLSGLIAVPIVYTLSISWLNNFTVKIPLSWYYFVIPLLLVIILIVITILLRMVKATQINPAKLLRYE